MKEIQVFKEPQSGAWFYSFSYKWVVYRSNQGYETRWEAYMAAELHFGEVTGL